MTESVQVTRTEQVEQVLRLIKPAMEADGGGIDDFEIIGSVVRVRLRGACLYCPSFSLTLKLGIEKTLKEQLNWVSRVERMMPY